VLRQIDEEKYRADQERKKLVAKQMGLEKLPVREIKQVGDLPKYDYDEKVRQFD